MRRLAHVGSRPDPASPGLMLAGLVAIGLRVPQRRMRRPVSASNRTSRCRYMLSNTTIAPYSSNAIKA